jgi:hypothetical protein
MKTEKDKEEVIAFTPRLCIERKSYCFAVPNKDLAGTLQVLFQKSLEMENFQIQPSDAKSFIVRCTIPADRNPIDYIEKAGIGVCRAS